MRQRSSLRNVVEYVLALTILKSLEWLPAGASHGLARFYMRMLDRAIPRLRRAARQNLALALPDGNAESITDGVFRSLARMLVAFAKFPSIRKENLDRWLRAEGTEHVQAALRQGRGVLFATAHVGNWELSAYAWALLAGPMHVVVRPLDNPLIDRLIERRRALSGNRIIAKQEYARAILKALAAGEAVGILIDQNVAAEAGVFVDFFGVPASAGTGLAKIAARTGAAVVPGFALWYEAERRYVLRFLPAVPITGDAVRDTQALQSTIEAVIREYPDQWLWLHRRWKTRPAGEPSLYENVPPGGRTV